MSLLQTWWEGVKMACDGYEVWVSLGLFVLVFVVNYKLRPSPAEFRCARCGRWVHGSRVTPVDCANCREPERTDYS